MSLLARPLRLLLAAVVFATAYGQMLPYSTNQFQYYLHGFARAGVGDLATDWLARTKDPTPVFSAMVATLVKSLGHWSLHAAYFCALIIYFLSCRGIASSSSLFPKTRAGESAFAAAFILVHATIVRSIVIRLTGDDLLYLFQSGVAAQYTLGPGFQPAVFGVFLLAAIAAFAHGRPFAAAFLVGTACVVHSTYLLAGGSLIAGMMLALARERRFRAAVGTGAIALACVLPVIVYNLSTFRPTSSEAFSEAQRTLAFFRLPHHANVSQWLNGGAAFQLAWLSLGVFFSRHSPLFPVLVVALSIGVALGLVQIATGNATLALLFPWRISVVLVPVATTYAAAWIGRFADCRREGLVVAICALLSTAAAAGAFVAHMKRAGDRTEEFELTQFVAANRSPGSVFLIPAGFGGSQMPSFAMESFRLATGAAVFVDNKSIPYLDLDVLEWRRRVDQAEQWQLSIVRDPEKASEEMAAEGITHVVVPADQSVESNFWELLYDDRAFRLYRMCRGGDAR